MNIIWCMFPEIWSIANIIFCYFRPFFALLLPPKTWKIKVLEKLKNISRCPFGQNFRKTINIGLMRLPPQEWRNVGPGIAKNSVFFKKKQPKNFKLIVCTEETKRDCYFPDCIFNIDGYECPPYTRYRDNRGGSKIRFGKVCPWVDWKI